MKLKPEKGELLVIFPEQFLAAAEESVFLIPDLDDGVVWGFDAQNLEQVSQCITLPDDLPWNLSEIFRVLGGANFVLSQEGEIALKKNSPVEKCLRGMGDKLRFEGKGLVFEITRG